MGSVLELLYEGRGIVIEGDEVVLGRVKSCTLRVVHPLVSRQHCRISVASDGIFVEDMGSSNGTFVNGNRVRGREQVRAGDRVTLGRGGAELTIVGAEVDGEDVAGFDPEVARATLVAGDPRAQAFRARVTVDSQALPQLEMDEVVGESAILEDDLRAAESNDYSDYEDYEVTEPAQLSAPQPAGESADYDPLELSSSQEIPYDDAGAPPDGAPPPGFREEPTRMMEDGPPTVEPSQLPSPSPPPRAPPPPPPPAPPPAQLRPLSEPPLSDPEYPDPAYAEEPDSEPPTRPVHAQTPVSNDYEEEKTEMVSPVAPRTAPVPPPPPPAARPAARPAAELETHREPPKARPEREPAAAATTGSEEGEGGAGLGFVVGLLVGLLLVAVLAVATPLADKLGEMLPGARVVRIGGDGEDTK